MNGQTAVQQQTWSPTAAGKLFTAAPPWMLALQGEQFELTVEGKRLQGNIAQLENCILTPGTFWATFEVFGPSGKSLKLDGIPNAQARRLNAAVFDGSQSKAASGGNGATHPPIRRLAPPRWLSGPDSLRMQLKDSWAAEVG